MKLIIILCLKIALFLSKWLSSYSWQAFSYPVFLVLWKTFWIADSLKTQAVCSQMTRCFDWAILGLGCSLAFCREPAVLHCGLTKSSCCIHFSLDYEKLTGQNFSFQALLCFQCYWILLSVLKTLTFSAFSDIQRLEKGRETRRLWKKQIVYNFCTCAEVIFLH